MKSFLRPSSLYGQLMLAMLLGAAILQGINIYAVCFIQHSYNTEVLRVKYDYDATIYVALQKMNPEQRLVFLRKISESHNALSLLARFHIVPQQPTWSSDGSSKADTTIEEMRMALAAGVAKGFANMRVRIVDRSMPGASEMGYARNEFPLLQTAVQIDEDSWLEITQPLRISNVKAVWAQRLFILLESIIFSIAIIIIIRRATGPLRRFALAAESFGRNPELMQPLEEAGSKEVREATQSFNRMRQRIYDNLNERNGMLEAMGHDLRTPLARVQLRLEKVKPEELRDQLVANTNEVQSIIEQGLELARSFTPSEPFVPLDIAAFLQSIVDDAEEEGENISFGSPPGEDLPQILVSARPTSLRRSIENLIRNALKYAGNAEVSIAKQGNCVIIDVEDSGPGIPDELLEKVFEPYYRLESSRNRDSGGTGLGLSIARNMLLLNNGTLTLTNRPEGGLRARIELPLEHRPAGHAK